MKKMKLYSPGKPITQSQHCRCSWCESGRDPISEGVCRTCHDKLQSQLCSSKWTKLRRSYLDTLETGLCHGFIVLSPSTPSPSTSLTSPIAIPLHYHALLRFMEEYMILFGNGKISLAWHYHLCQSSIAIPAQRIDHILPWHNFPSLFWLSENHQSLCTVCNGRKTQLDGSHRTDTRQSR